MFKLYTCHLYRRVFSNRKCLNIDDSDQKAKAQRSLLPLLKLTEHGATQVA